MQRTRGPMLRRRAAQEQRVAVPDAAEDREAGAIDGNNAVDDVVDDEADDDDDDARAQSPEQHV